MSSSVLHPKDGRRAYLIKGNRPNSLNSAIVGNTLASPRFEPFHPLVVILFAHHPIKFLEDRLHSGLLASDQWNIVHKLNSTPLGIVA
jgi:hypothetical protein